MKSPEGRSDRHRISLAQWRMTPWDGDGPVTRVDRLLDRLDAALPGWQTAVELGLFAVYLAVLIVEFAEHLG